MVLTYHAVSPVLNNPSLCSSNPSHSALCVCACVCVVVVEAEAAQASPDAATAAPAPTGDQLQELESAADAALAQAKAGHAAWTAHVAAVKTALEMITNVCSSDADVDVDDTPATGAVSSAAHAAMLEAGIIGNVRACVSFPVALSCSCSFHNAAVSPVALLVVTRCWVFCALSCRS